MFPLKQRKLIRGAAAHVAAGLGVAADYVASTGTPYFAPFNGTLSIPYGPNGQGGIWIRLTRPDGTKIEVAHLQRYVKSSGQVSEGELIAYTDNTGKLTSGPHAHIQILDKNNNRVDPEKFNWLTTGGSMALQDTKLVDLPEEEFNKFHDIGNVQYPGWTKEIYNKGRNAFSDYKKYHPTWTVLDLLNYIYLDPGYKKIRDDLRANQGSVDKSSIRDHANQIIKLVS